MITSLSSTYKPLSECHQETSDSSGYGPRLSRWSREGGAEMTSIAVLPPATSTTATAQGPGLDTVVVHHQPDCHVLAKHKLATAGGAGDRFASNSRRTGRGEIVWTNFHCLLCLGLSGFFIFWTAILLRMYLPVDSFPMSWWLARSKS